MQAIVGMEMDKAKALSFERLLYFFIFLFIYGVLCHIRSQIEECFPNMHPFMRLSKAFFAQKSNFTLTHTRTQRSTTRSSC